MIAFITMLALWQSIIIGTDDRKQIKNTTAIPYKTVGMILFERDGALRSCTGTLLSKKHVLTARHCLIDKDKNYSINIRFYPGKNGNKNPFGEYEAESILIPSPWDDPKKDYGMIILDRDYEHSTNFMDIREMNGINVNLNLISYPSDKPFGTQWGSFCKSNVIFKDYIKHQCDTYAGSSGAVMFRYDKAKSERIIYGIHVGGMKDANRAVKITKEVLDEIEYWMFRYP